MSNKSKGSNAERELLGLFREHGWRSARVAGSGVNDESPCDLIAGKAGKTGKAVEAKSSKKTRIYISRAQVEDFLMFAEMTGLEAVFAARFNREGWFFLKPEMLESSGGNWVISLEQSKTKGKRFAQFFE